MAEPYRKATAKFGDTWWQHYIIIEHIIVTCIFIYRDLLRKCPLPVQLPEIDKDDIANKT